MSRLTLCMPRRLGVISITAAAALLLTSVASVRAGDAGMDSSPGVMIEPPIPSGPALDSSAALHSNQPQTTNALIGYVNSEPVFALDIFRPIDEDLRSLARSSSNFRRDALPLIRRQIQDYMNESLLFTAAQAAMTDNDKQVLDSNFNKKNSELLSKWGGGSEAAADKTLAASGSTLQKERTFIRRSLTVQIYMYKNLGPKVVITRPMVLDAYEKDAAKWQQKASIELYTITLPVVRFLRQPTTDGTKGPLIEHPTADQIKSAENQAMAVAKTIVTSLKASLPKNQNADFTRFVEDNSSDQYANRGGRWPAVVKGELDTRLEQYVFSLPANTIGDPLLLHDDNPSRSHVVIAKIGEKKEARTIPFDEAQPEIVKSLSEQQRRDLEAQYLEKLYKDGAVEGLDHMVNVAVDAAVTRYAAD